MIVKKAKKKDVFTLEKFGSEIELSHRCSQTGVETSPHNADIHHFVKNSRSVFVEDEGVIKGFVLFNTDGIIKWLVLPLDDSFTDVAPLLLGAVETACGACKGEVENPDLYQKLMDVGCSPGEDTWVIYG
jgi:hypothetical protein